MATFITRIDGSGSGPTLAVKDLINLEGIPTTAGSQAVASRAEPAESDALLMAGARAAGCRIVGKANLHELAFGTSGVNPYFGTPQNPLDARLIPGGSSSGSAVAVASGEAELAYGSDTGGSIRIPAAFCGVTGLKTTIGRIPLEGVVPLSPSFDTVGPMAVDLAGVNRAMALLEPGFRPGSSPAETIGRLRIPDEDGDPTIDLAVDDALRAGGFHILEIDLPEWLDAYANCSDLLIAEAASTNRWVLDDPEAAAQVSEAVRTRLQAGAAVNDERIEATRRYQADWQARLDALFERVELLALPSVGIFPPPIEEAAAHVYNRFTNPVNLAGLPALSQPIESGGRLPASLQLIGPKNSEALLCATGAVVEATAGQLIGS